MIPRGADSDNRRNYSRNDKKNCISLFKFCIDNLTPAAGFSAGARVCESAAAGILGFQLQILQLTLAIGNTATKRRLRRSLMAAALQDASTEDSFQKLLSSNRHVRNWHSGMRSSTARLVL